MTLLFDLGDIDETEAQVNEVAHLMEPAALEFCRSTIERLRADARDMIKAREKAVAWAEEICHGND